MSLTFASYVLQPFFSVECPTPETAKQLLAALTICLLTYLNSFYMNATTKLQNVIMFTKIAALLIIIVVGIACMSMGKFIASKASIKLLIILLKLYICICFYQFI